MDSPSWDGPSRSRGINLSTNRSSTSSALLSSVRAERLVREHKRKEEETAIVIQRTWRGVTEGRRAREEVLKRLESGGIEGLRARAGALIVILRGRGEEGRKRKEVIKWCVDAKEASNGVPAFAQPINLDPSYAVILGLLSCKIVKMVVDTPTTTQAALLLAGLEAVLDPKAYESFDHDISQEVKKEIVDCLEGGDWVQMLVQAVEKLIAASLPKKKHPHLQPVIRLLTAPFALVPPTVSSPLMQPLITHLLAVPFLPSALSISSLTHLSATLPLFSFLLPIAANRPSILAAGKLESELGKTYFLANLATFGIAGGMLKRFGETGADSWAKVIGEVVAHLGDGWGRWAEGYIEPEDEDEVFSAKVDSEDEDEPMPVVSANTAIAAPPLGKRRRHHRSLLPANLSSKLVLLPSSGHLSTLIDLLLLGTPSTLLRVEPDLPPPSPILGFSMCALALLRAFRGSPKWEVLLDTLLDGARGRMTTNQLWLGGVSGRWGQSLMRKSGWEKFSQDSSNPCLLLITHAYCHYLLLTPDDEFFSPANPLPMDAILDLAGIWRDLGYWAYMLGVAPSGLAPTRGVGTEETRSLLTRGVIRLAERNARRKFLPDDFWVMSSLMDLQGFVGAAVLEDAALSQEDSVDPILAPGGILRRGRGRQRFSKRDLAFISPRLGLLNNLPMVIPFQTRVEVFNRFIQSDWEKHRHNRTRRDRRVGVTIHRATLAEDGFRGLNSLGPSLKERIQITFIDKFGEEEMGIDGGGLFKEFFTSLSKEVFNTDRGLWLATDQNELYPNPLSFATEAHQLSWYGFIGRILGKALYEGILVDVSFAGFFLAKWLGRQSYLDDLNSLDSDLYRGLIKLKNLPNPEDLALTFAVTEEEFGVARTVDLVSGGSDLPVTAENRHEYIQLMCKYKLDKQIALQSRAFFDGLSDIIDSKWLRLFDPKELQQLIGGEETPIDIDDLRANSVVSGFPSDITMRLFWTVVKNFDQEQRRALLRFVTSCSRPPLLGFAQLNPQFGIRFGGRDATRLPSASSCANLLKLPGYTDEHSLRSKLLQAITSGSGFYLS